jgi:catechol 2,3-dioxygenase-like lactoylglutathione lyase family enzyme
MDAIAVTLASRGRYLGVAPLGTSLNDEQASQLAGIGVHPLKWPTPTSPAASQPNVTALTDDPRPGLQPGRFTGAILGARALLLLATPINGGHMTSTDQSNQTGSQMQSNMGVDMKLEVVTLPVSDVDRAKTFYQNLGWRLDADFVLGDDIRAVQLTPPHSECSISFGKGLTTAPPGSAQRMELVVSNIDAAREDLISRGVEVSEVFHRDGGQLLPGPDPEHRSYLSYASFNDPDGNSWLLQEVTTRLPGRMWDD